METASEGPGGLAARAMNRLLAIDGSIDPWYFTSCKNTRESDNDEHSPRSGMRRVAELMNRIDLVVERECDFLDHL